MLLTDSLIVLGLASVSLGTIQEADGPREHTFWLLNTGTQAVTLQQGYTSCGCTTIRFDQQAVISPADSTAVTLHFNPRGKGGEFREVGTLRYTSHAPAEAGGVAASRHLQLTLTGTCITSEETLLRQFPIRVSDRLRLSADRFDLGYMSPGEQKQRNVVVLHRGHDGDRQERHKVTFRVDEHTPKGLQHVVRELKTRDGHTEVTLKVTLDVIVK